MARRNGKKGDYLASSDYSSCTEYASKLIQDYWHDFGLRNEVIKRNLQEVAVPLNDPYPVSFYRGPTYEVTDGCIADIIPATIGTTNRPFPTNSAAVQSQVLNINPGIGQMSIGCSFEVR